MSKRAGEKGVKDSGPNFDLHTRDANTGAGAQRLTGGKDGARFGAGGRPVPTPRCGTTARDGAA